MTKTLLAILLLLFGCLTPSVDAAPAVRYETATSTAAQDGTGTVWALPDYASRDDKISRWQAGAWVSVAAPETRGFRLLALTAGGAGNVYGLWQRYTQRPDGPQCLVTTQHGTQIQALALFDGAVLRESGFPNTPKIYAGTGGDVWVIGSEASLRHITAAGAVQTFPFQAAWYTGGKIPQSYNAPAFPPPIIESLADGAGRRWFWQDKSVFFGRQTDLPGILIWDGKTLEDRPVLAGLTAYSRFVLAPRDANHVWLAEDDPMQRPRRPGGLFVLNTRTLTAVPEPTPPGFQNVTQVFEAGGDWYSVNTNPFGWGESSLWRKRGGVWQRVISSLEAPGGYYRPDTRHAWLDERDGLWIGSGGGAWWLPHKTGRPLWVDWRRGLAAGIFTGLFPLPSGRILAFGFGDHAGTTEMPATPAPIRPLPPGVSVGGMGAPLNLEPPLADPRRHLWAAQIYYTQTPSLDEWDGRQWRIHAIPKIIAGVGSLYACDTLGRLWFSTSNWHPPTQPHPIEGRAVYDPAQDAWTNYTTTEDALAAAAALPGMVFLPRYNLNEPPVFSGDGRVTYISGNTETSLYDGKKWLKWQSGDILKGYGGNGPYLPHFNSQGRLELILDVRICDWTPDAGWQPTGAQRDTRYSSPVPPGGPRGLWGIPAEDNLGVKWFQWQDAVYAAGYGLWAKPADLSLPGSPFTQGFGIQNVLRDPDGHLFFVSNPAGHLALVVWSPPPVPKPSVSVTPLSEDSVSVRFSSALSGPHWFLWRVNSGQWSAPQTAKTQAFTALPRGDYRLEVQALDSRLQVSPSAVAVWSVRVDQETQIARWIAALSAGPDNAREIAVAGLEKQPAAALPALKAARPAASDLGKWWIDAAIQQITDTQKITAGETPKIAN